MSFHIIVPAIFLVDLYIISLQSVNNLSIGYYGVSLQPGLL